MKEGSPQGVRWTRGVADLGSIVGSAATGGWLVSNPLVQVGPCHVFDGVTGSIIFQRGSGPALERHDVEASSAQLLGENAANSTHANDTDIRDRLSHPWVSRPGKPSTATGG